MSEVATQPGTEIALLPPVERAQIVLDSTKTEQYLKDLIEEAKTIEEVDCKDDREQAHRIGMKLKNARTSIEKTGKTAREDAQAFSKAVIDEEKRLKAITAAEEDRVFALRDAFDAKVAAEKVEREKVERERVALIRGQIDGIRNLPLQSARDTAADIEATLADLTAFEITTELFAEFSEEAATTRHQAMGELREMLEAAKAREAAAAAVAAERAELERLRAEAAERERVEADRLKAEAERLAAERAEFDRERAEFEAAKKAAETPAAPFIGVDMGGDDRTVIRTIDPENAQRAYNVSVSNMLDALATAPTPTTDADTLVSELAGYTSMQLLALAKKVEAVDPAFDLVWMLRDIARDLANGEMHYSIKAANWMAMADADKELALASHACVALIVGDDELGASVLREVAA